MPAQFDHKNCDHPATKEARKECRQQRRKAGESPSLSDDPKKIRDRARRHQKKMETELSKLYKKPVSEWDLEELAHGKPRSKDGYFSGVPPKWVTREVHAEAMRRFKHMIHSKIRVLSVPAIDVLMNLMADNQLVYDDEGQPIRYIVPPNVKAQIGQYLIDHVVGKSQQTVETKGEVMHLIQSVLASSVVNPGEDPDEVIELEAGEEDDDDEPSTSPRPYDL